MNRAVASPVSLQATPLASDPAIIARYLEDAAHYPGGVATAVARPATLEEAAWVVRHAEAVLPVGAQSSLTGGATPARDIVLSTERLTHLAIGDDHVIAGAGVTLQMLQDALAVQDAWFPPVPTFLGATVGGAIATNAAGATTFKYGPVRRWVRALTIVLANGEVLRLRRGDAIASPDGIFVIATRGEERRVAVPSIRMPAVPKCSAGYFAAPAMDLVDLFIGSEGTLGVIVEAELAVRRRPAGVCWMLVSLSSEEAAIALAGDLRNARTIDVSAIEHLDRRSLDVLREDGVDRRLGISIAPETAVVLLVQMELAGGDGSVDAEWEGALERLLREYAVVDAAEIALPSNRRRQAAFVELREAVPAGVNRRVARAHAVDARIHKTAADMVVPFEHFGQMMRDCRSLCRERDLDLAVWGHISDGNVHPNVIPRSYADVEQGGDAIVRLAERVIALGGSPLAEHGVGRNVTKQRLLAMLYGPDGVEAMRRVKLSLDPEWKLARGLLFEGATSCDAG